ncbi:hypothetical protein V8F20_006241 [Naviculisporaceae sp. PSN 640]
MTTSPPDVQSTPGPRQPDAKPDLICDRIPFGLGRTPGRRRTVPRWFPIQVVKLMTSSPTVQARINKLKADDDENETWEIRSKPEDGIHASVVFEVFDMVATETEMDPAELKDVAEVVSQFCNVMWFYEIIPARFPSSKKWTVIDGATELPIGAHEITPDPFLHHVTTNGTHHSTISTITAGRTPWCWERSSSLVLQFGGYETTMQLANCALILGWRDVFKRSIKPLIWETQPESSILITPVKYLKQAGPDGLKERRQQEKEQVLTHLLRYLTRYQKLDRASFDKATAALTNHGIELSDMPSDFTQPSVYELIRDIEAALAPGAAAAISLPPPTPPPPPPPPPSGPESSRRTHTRKPTHVSSSSSGSNDLAAGPMGHPGTSRQGTTLTGSSANARKSNAHKRRSGSHGGPNSSGSSLPSPPAQNRPAGLPILPVLHHMGSTAVAMVSHLSNSGSRREPRLGPEPEPDPPPPRRGGIARYDEFVRELLEELHNFVLYRQAVVANDLLARRDKDVEGWEARLL